MHHRHQQPTSNGTSAGEECAYDIEEPYLKGIVDLNAAASVFAHFECNTLVSLLVALKVLLFVVVFGALLHYVLTAKPVRMHQEENYLIDVARRSSSASRPLWGVLCLIWVDLTILLADVDDLGQGSGRNGYTRNGEAYTFLTTLFPILELCPR